MTDNLLKSQVFKLKGRVYTLTVIQLLSGEKESFARQLDELIEKAPKLFNFAPVVVDCTLIHDESIDLMALCECLRSHHLLPVGVQGANPAVNAIAQCNGLAIVNASASHDRVVVDSPQADVSSAHHEAAKTKLLTTPVRSGQQAVSKGGDLIVTSSVSHGAELLADGNIHIYGALRGRALAGISGDKNARIFCLSLEAELVSIAGFYRLSDAIEPINGPCQIYLQDDHIHIEALC